MAEPEFDPSHFNPYDLLDDASSPGQRAAALKKQQQQQSAAASKRRPTAGSARSSNSSGAPGAAAGGRASGSGGGSAAPAPAGRGAGGGGGGAAAAPGGGGPSSSAAAGGAAGGAPRPFDFYRAFQRVFVDRAAEEVVLRFHRTDVVRVRSNGDVRLTTGGHPTATTLACINDALAPMGMSLRPAAGAPVTEGKWTLHDGSSAVRFSDGMVLQARKPEDAGRGAAVFDAYTGGSVPFPLQRHQPQQQHQQHQQHQPQHHQHHYQQQQHQHHYQQQQQQQSDSSGVTVRSASVQEQLAAALAAQSFGDDDCGDGEDDDLDDDEACVVCFAMPRTIALVPCGHHVLCTGCAADVMEQGAECPMCRKPIEECVSLV